MDGKILEKARKICVAVFAGNILLHGIAGAVMIHGPAVGIGSMGAMLAFIFILKER